jgi:hypothetical protein
MTLEPPSTCNCPLERSKGRQFSFERSRSRSPRRSDGSILCFTSSCRRLGPIAGGRAGSPPKFSRASERASVSSNQSELHGRDFSRSSCLTSRASKTIDLDSRHCAWEVRRSSPRFATSCPPSSAA